MGFQRVPIRLVELLRLERAVSEPRQRFYSLGRDTMGGSVEDLGSKNGTILNGRTIDGPTVLTDGALIVLGATL